MKTQIKTPEETFKYHYLKKSGKPADDVVMHYMQYCIDAIVEYHDQFKPKKEKKPKIEIPQDMLNLYNEIFPNIKGGSGKRLRCNLKELEKSFQYFFKQYPDTSWEAILQATELYINEQSKDDYKWTRTAKYFCIKFKQPGQPESELIEFVERIIQGDTFEEEIKTTWEPKVY